MEWLYKTLKTLIIVLGILAGIIIFIMGGVIFLLLA